MENLDSGLKASKFDNRILEITYALQAQAPEKLCLSKLLHKNTKTPRKPKLELEIMAILFRL